MMVVVVVPRSMIVPPASGIHQPRGIPPFDLPRQLCLGRRVKLAPALVVDRPGIYRWERLVKRDHPPQLALELGLLCGVSV